MTTDDAARLAEIAWEDWDGGEPISNDPYVLVAQFKETFLAGYRAAARAVPASQSVEEAYLELRYALGAFHVSLNARTGTVVDEKRALYEAAIRAESAVPAPQLTCETCGASFKTERGLHQHLRNEGRRDVEAQMEYDYADHTH